LLLALVASSYCLSRKSTMKRRTKSEGGGSWADGYECPGIVLVESDQSFDYSKRQKATFYATKFEAPSSSQDKIGWVFKMASPPTGILAKVMVQISSSSWYIPYRWLSGDFIYTNPWNDYKYIEGWVTNDSQANYHFRILLPYQTIGWAINDDEGEKIAGFLNQKRSEHRGYVINDKQAAISAANAYITNKPLYDAATTSSSSFAAAQQTQKETKATLVSSLTEKQKTFTENAATIQGLESQLQTLRTQQDALNQQIGSIGGQINAIDTAIANAAAAGQSASDQAAALKPKVDKALSDLAAALADLKVEAPNRGTEVDNAKNAVTSLDKPTFSSSLAKIMP